MDPMLSQERLRHRGSDRAASAEARTHQLRRLRRPMGPALAGGADLVRAQVVSVSTGYLAEAGRGRRGMAGRPRPRIRSPRWTTRAAPPSPPTGIRGRAPRPAPAPG